MNNTVFIERVNFTHITNQLKILNERNLFFLYMIDVSYIDFAIFYTREPNSIINFRN